MRWHGMTKAGWRNIHSVFLHCSVRNKQQKFWKVWNIRNMYRIPLLTTFRHLVVFNLVLSLLHMEAKGIADGVIDIFAFIDTSCNNPDNISATSIAFDSAVEDVVMSGMLPREFEVHVRIVPSQCDRDDTRDKLDRLISSGTEGSIPPTLIGGCREDCDEMVKASGKSHSLVLCYSTESTPVALGSGSGSSLPSTAFQLYPNPRVHLGATAALLRHFRWTNVILLYQPEMNLTIEQIDTWKGTLTTGGIHVLSIDKVDILQDLMTLEDKVKDGAFVAFVALGHNDWIHWLVCNALQSTSKLVSSNVTTTVWILPNKLIQSVDKFWLESESMNDDDRRECTKEEVLKAFEGHWVTTPVTWNELSTQTVEVMQTVKQHLGQKGGGIHSDYYDETPFAYDAVWIAAVGVKEVLKVTAQENNSTAFGDLLRKKVLESNFKGVSGRLSWTGNGERKVSTGQVFLSRFWNGKYVTMGVHSHDPNVIHWDPNPNDLNLSLTFPVSDTTLPPPPGNTISSAMSLGPSAFYLFSFILTFYCITA